MDKLLYESQSFLSSLRIGASIDGNNDLIKTIENYQNRLTSQSKFDNTENYNQSDLFMQNARLSQSADNLKRAMEAYLSDPHPDTHSTTQFLFHLHNYKLLKADKEKIERVVKEQEKVTEIFGGFTNNKYVKKGSKVVIEYRPSQELIDERNDRLAMLNQMHVNGDISDAEFSKSVVAVRRTYDRNIENQTIREVRTEALAQQKENTVGEKLKSKAKGIISKVAKVFKINVENLKNVEVKNDQEDLKRQIIERNAAQALGKTADILAQNNDMTKDAVIDEVTELAKDGFEIIKSQTNEIELTKITQGMYKVQILNAKTEEDKEYYRNKTVNFGQVLVANTNGKISVNHDLESQKQAFEDYMWKTYETKSEFKEGLSVPIASFKDETIEKFYWDAIHQFDKNIAKANEMVNVQDVVKNMTEQNQSRIQNKSEVENSH